MENLKIIERLESEVAALKQQLFVDREGAKAQILAAENVQKDLRRDITKLKREICELRQDNRKLAHEVEDRVNKMRKAGM
jgi:cell division protein FtsB